MGPTKIIDTMANRVRKVKKANGSKPRVPFSRSRKLSVKSRYLKSQLPNPIRFTFRSLDNDILSKIFEFVSCAQLCFISRTSTIFIHKMRNGEDYICRNMKQNLVQIKKM